ncbi:MAG: Hint domain-containing protein [Pseudomonadota bacterium]
MNTPRHLSVATGTRLAARPASRKWNVRTAHLPQPAPIVRELPRTRRYEVRFADERGDVQEFVRIAPALPAFEAGFNAFTHGALIMTTTGPVAVEDLEPGMYLETASGRAVELKWLGAITLVPGAPCAEPGQSRTYRVCADAFGLGRPASDVTLGPGARLLNRSPDLRATLGTEGALAPVADFADGMSVVELTPVSPVRVYHLALNGHEVIYANGIEVESFHPGPQTALSLSTEMADFFLGLFPHITRFEDFGRMLWPRADEMS